MDMVGIRVEWVNINNIRGANDVVIIADTVEELQALLDMIKRESERMGLKINIKKTQAVVALKIPEPQSAT